MKTKELSLFNITTENYTQLVFEQYHNAIMISEEEVLEDVYRIKFIKRLIKNYFTKGMINHRLLINHIIVLNNVFDTRFMIELLFYHIEDNNMMVVLKTFLLYLGYIKEDYLPDVGVDVNIAKILRNL